MSQGTPQSSPSAAAAPPSERLFVAGLATPVDAGALVKMFAQYGKVVRFDVPPGRGYAFVTMASVGEARAAVNAFKGRPGPRVQFQRSQQPTHSPGGGGAGGGGGGRARSRSRSRSRGRGRNRRRGGHSASPRPNASFDDEVADVAERLGRLTIDDAPGAKPKPNPRQQQPQKHQQQQQQQGQRPAGSPQRTKKQRRRRGDSPVGNGAPLAPPPAGSPAAVAAAFTPPASFSSPYAAAAYVPPPLGPMPQLLHQLAPLPRVKPLKVAPTIVGGVTQYMLLARRSGAAATDATSAPAALARLLAELTRLVGAPVAEHAAVRPAHGQFAVVLLPTADSARLLSRASVPDWALERVEFHGWRDELDGGDFELFREKRGQFRDLSALLDEALAACAEEVASKTLKARLAAAKTDAARQAARAEATAAAWSTPRKALQLLALYLKRRLNERADAFKRAGALPAAVLYGQLADRFHVSQTAQYKSSSVLGLLEGLRASAETFELAVAHFLGAPEPLRPLVAFAKYHSHAVHHVRALGHPRFPVTPVTWLNQAFVLVILYRQLVADDTIPNVLRLLPAV